MNKNLLKLVLANFLVLFLTVASFAQTNYYVSTTGSNANSGLTGSPKLTIQAALDAIAAIPLASRDVNGYIVNISAGTFNEALTIKTEKTKLLGAGSGTNGNAVPAAVNASIHTVISGAGLGTTRGIFFSTTLTDVTIEALVVTGFGSEGIETKASSDRFTVRNVNVNNCGGQGGIFVRGPVNTVLIENSASMINAGRAIVVWDNFKQNITIQNNYVVLGGCCGIELQDGTASGVNINNNTVVGGPTGDSGIAAIGLKAGAGASIIANNTIDMYKRYGMEIKNPAGSGSEDETQDGTIVVRGNNITRAGSITEARDLAGIAIFRRAFTAGNPSGYTDVPSGVVVKNNTISGFAQPDAVGEGYGVVVEGVRMTVKGNTISNSDVGVQRQAGNPSGYVKNDIGDADQVASGSAYFDRGNSPYASSITIGTNTFAGNGIDTKDQFAAAANYLGDAQYVYNTTLKSNFATINLGVEYASAGHTLNLSPSTFNELVTVNKSVTIDGLDKTLSKINYSGAALNGTTIPALFAVSAQNVTLKNIGMEVDLSKIWSAVITSGEVAGLLIKDNSIKAIRTATTNAAGYTDRNALGLNVVGRTIPGNPAIVNTPVGVITVQGNTISYSPDGGFGVAAFRAGVAADNYSVVVGGNTVAEGNTIQTINHDVTNRFQTTAFQSILKNNTFNGGGIEFSEANGGFTGAVIESNDFNYLFPTAPFALVRLKNNNQNKPHLLKNNTFRNHYWLVSLENFQNVTLDGNTFSPVLDGVTGFRSLTINTKTNSTSSNTKLPISATIINNTFNGVSGAVNSNAISFLNHDSNGALFGDFIVGDVGKYNTFNDNHTNFIYLDNSNGAPTRVGSVGLTGYPEYGEFAITTTAYFTPNIKADLNNFYVAGSLKVPSALTVPERTTLDGFIFDKKDDANVGEVQYYFPIRNLTTNEGFASLQAANDGVNTVAGHVINVDAGTYTLTTGVTLTKGITLRGNNNVLASKPIINGTGNATTKALIEINSPNVKIQNFEFQIAQTANAMIGVSTTSTDNFNNLEISDNIFKGMKTFATGYVFESYGVKLGRGQSGIKNQISVVRNATTYANANPDLFGRGIYAYNTYGQIGGSVANANSLAAVYAFQGGEIGSSGNAFEFSYNQVLGGLVTIFGADPGNHLINNNSIGGSVSLAQAGQISRMVEIKGSRTAGANIEFANNTVSNYTNIGVFIQKSSNVTLKNNTLSPFVDASNTGFSSIVFSSKEGTAGTTSATTLQNLTITGNTLKGSGTTGGVGIAFYNHQAAVGVKPLTNAKIGGAGILQNVFDANLFSYITLDATPTGTTATLATLYDEPQTVANTTDILPFNSDIDAAYNTFGLTSGINTETETVFDNLVAVKAKITDGIDNNSTGYVSIQPQKAFINSLGNMSNALIAVPDNFTLILKNNAAVYGNLTGNIITKAHTFAIDGNVANSISINGLTVNAAGKEVKFTNPVAVSGTFSLQAGKITPAQGITLNGAGTISVTKGSGNFINGDVNVINVTGNLLFPVGKTVAAYIELTNATGTSSNFTVKYFNSSATSTGSFDPTLGSVSTSEYWDLNRTSGTLTGKVALYTYDAAASQITAFDPASTSVTWFDGTKWKDMGNAGNPISTAIQANVSNPNLGFFTFAKTQANVLSVNLLDFKAKATAGGALLTWSTSQEKDNAGFELEKSLDGINFQKIGSVGASTLR